MTRLRRLRRPAHVAALALASVFAAGVASASTSDVSPTGFLVSLRAETSATPQQLYAALPQVGRWWSDRHTWSGSAANLSLEAAVGGCFCERWGRNSVEHGRVIQALEDRSLRLAAALGPLQDRAVSGVLTFSFERAPGATASTAQLAYRVSGAAPAALDALAVPVDGVLADMLKRLVRFAETGRPE
jgi:hypothetical protein